MQYDDFRINAAVRTQLIRAWIDTNLLDHGTINGIVYLRGTLRRELLRDDPTEKGSDESLRLILQRLERQIRAIRGVRDVVCNLENVARVKGQWVPRTAAS